MFCEGKSEYLDETDAIAWRLLNTKEFQRLRRIRQLGFSDLVYPGATHSRFSHSIGVYHIARLLIDLIHRRKQQGRIRESILESASTDQKNRERVILLAALLHDVGHGPFSHVFETVTRKRKGHEDWSAEIVTNKSTSINRILSSYKDLATETSNVLKSDRPADIYANIVSSQFDADRLDYVQRDRYMTGVQSAHIDIDWLFDCLEVGKVTIGDPGCPIPAPCLYINSKGKHVAEEYLLARRELYRTVYFHKTTRAAEKMLTLLLDKTTKNIKHDDSLCSDPLLNYLSKENPTMAEYTALDDNSVWSCIRTLASSSSDADVQCLATRLCNRTLYKCVDLGELDKRFITGNLMHQMRDKLAGNSLAVYYDDPSTEAYTEYPFRGKDPLKKILVRISQDGEPEDIIDHSEVLRNDQSVDFRRAYVSGQDEREELSKIARGVCN